MSTGAWRDRAACQGHEDPELWFSDDLRDHKGRDARTATARAVCATCPVADDCLAWAITHRADHGMWGGLTADERTTLRRAVIR